MQYTAPSRPQCFYFRTHGHTSNPYLPLLIYLSICLSIYPYVCLFISLSIYLSNSMSLSIPIDCNPRVQGRTVEHHFTRATPHHKVILFSHTFLYTHTISLCRAYTHRETNTLLRTLSLSLSLSHTSSLTSSHKLSHKLSQALSQTLSHTCFHSNKYTHTNSYALKALPTRRLWTVGSKLASKAAVL
jgi:hypothetical protein